MYNLPEYFCFSFLAEKVVGLEFGLALTLQIHDGIDLCWYGSLQPQVTIEHLRCGQSKLTCDVSAEYPLGLKDLV